MGLKKKTVTGIVDFIHPDDDAIDVSIDEATGLPKSDTEKYREEWDFEKYCVLKEGRIPTIFKINFSVPWKKSQAIKDATLGGSGKDDFGYKMGKHQAQVVKTILVDIVNAPDVPEEDKFNFRKDKHGLVTDETLQELDAMGIIELIYSYWITVKGDPDLIKKR